jgi:hypothetical protein
MLLYDDAGDESSFTAFQRESVRRVTKLERGVMSLQKFGVFLNDARRLTTSINVKRRETDASPTYHKRLSTK